MDYYMHNVTMIRDRFFYQKNIATLLSIISIFFSTIFFTNNICHSYPQIISEPDFFPRLSPNEKVDANKYAQYISKRIPHPASDLVGYNFRTANNIFCHWDNFNEYLNCIANTIPHYPTTTGSVHYLTLELNKDSTATVAEPINEESTAYPQSYRNQYQLLPLGKYLTFTIDPLGTYDKIPGVLTCLTRTDIVLACALSGTKNTSGFILSQQNNRFFGIVEHPK